MLSLCKAGSIAKLQILHEEGLFAPELVREGKCSAVLIACVQGHVETVQWLVDTFRLGADDVYAGQYPLNRVRERGHVAMANWLVNKFGDR